MTAPLKTPAQCTNKNFHQLFRNRILFQKPYTSAHDLVVHAHFVEDEEEGIMGGLGLIFLLDAVVGKKRLWHLSEN